MQTEREISIDPVVDPVVSPKSTIVITEPSRTSRRFEDNVRIIRKFTPDPAKEAAAIRHLLKWVAKEVHNDESDR